MPALADPTLWRTHPYHYKGYLFVPYAVDRVVFQARVNQSSFTYPISQVDYNTVTAGSISDVREDMLVVFGTTSRGQNRGRNRMRTGSNGTTLQFAKSSQGTRDGEVNLANSRFITVYDLYYVFAKIPFIGDDGTLYKDGDLTVGTRTTNPPPVANGGPPIFRILSYSQSSIYNVDFNASNSFAVADGATITGYSWSFPGGTPSTSSSVNPTIQYGNTQFQYAHLTVTDSNGNTHTCHVPVVLAKQQSDGTYTPTGLFDAVTPTITLRPEGAEASFQLKQAQVWNDYLDGSPVVYFEEEWYGDTKGSLSGPTGHEGIKFFGYMDTEPGNVSTNQTGEVKTSTLNCISPAAKLAKLPGFPTIVERNSSPTQWNHLKGADISKYIHYILHWHSTILTVTDYYPATAGATYSFATLGSDGGSIYEQADRRAQAIAHRLTCDQRGILRVVPDPMLLDTGARTATVIVALGEDDFKNFESSYDRSPKYHWVRGSALQTSAQDASIAQLKPFFCISPGKTPGQGMGSSEVGERLVLNQEELNISIGHYYAVRANPNNAAVGLELVHKGDAGIDPALFEWVTVFLTPAIHTWREFPFGAPFRCLPTEVSISYDNERQTKQVKLNLEREVTGTPAVTVLYNDDALHIPNYEVVDYGDLYVDAIEEVLPNFDYSEPPAVILATKGGHIARVTFDPITFVASFEDISLSAPQRTALGTNHWIVQDPFLEERVFICGNTRVHYTDDILAGTPSYSAAVQGAGATNKTRVMASFNRPGYFAWTNHATALMQYKYTTNSFSTLSTVTAGSSAMDGTDNPIWKGWNDGIALGWFNTNLRGEIWLAWSLFVLAGIINPPVDEIRTQLLYSGDWGVTWTGNPVPVQVPVAQVSTGVLGTDILMPGIAKLPFTLPGRAKNHGRIGLGFIDATGTVAGSFSAAYTAFNQGKTILTSPSLITNLRSSDIYINDIDGNYVYIGLGNELYASSNGGVLFNKYNPGLFTGRSTLLVGYPLNPTWIMMLSGVDNTATAYNGIAVSRDGGATWTDYSSDFATLSSGWAAGAAGHQFSNGIAIGFPLDWKRTKI